MLVDTHAHLDDAQFAHDLGAVLSRAGAAGVGRIVTIGTGVDSSRAAVRLAQAHPGVIFACVGIHPHEADRADDAALAEALARLVTDREHRAGLVRRALEVATANHDMGAIRGRFYDLLRAPR